MALTRYRVSDRGQMALPAATRRRWNLNGGGAVDIADIGGALIVVPAEQGGLRGMVRTSIDEAGGYAALVAAVQDDEPDLA